MKLSNFRIKNKIQIQNQRSDNQSNSNQQDSNNQDGNVPKSEQINFSSFFNTFEKLMNSFASSNLNQKPRPQNYQKNKSSRLDQIDFRDRFVIIDLPDFKDRQVDYKKLEHWLGQLSSEILSVAFYYMTQNKMDYNQTKAFVSECFLRNIVHLANHFDLTDKQIEFIDKQLKQKIFPYLITKYPLTSEKQVNKKLQAQVKSFDNSEVLQNDYLFSSDVVFQYRNNGRYDDLIMKLLNQIISRCDGKDKDRCSNFEQFEKLMTKIFEKPYQPEDVNFGRSEKNEEQKLINDQKLETNKQIQQQNSDSEKEKTQQSQKYKEKVKQYTDFLIGRKISENTLPYTEEEIKNRNIKIKSSSILRILTKWCEELWSKFENKIIFGKGKKSFL